MSIKNSRHDIPRVAKWAGPSYLGRSEIIVGKTTRMNFKTLGIWAAIALVMLAAYGVFSQGGRAGAAGETTYSQLLKNIDAGEVKRPTSTATSSRSGRRPASPTR